MQVIARALPLAAAISLAATATSSAGAAANDTPPANGAGETTLRGSVQSLAGRYLLLLLDERGFVDRVTLRDATALAPADLRLTPGLAVVVIGRPDGTTFDADEIDLADGSDAPGAPRADAGGARPTYAADDAASLADGPAYDAPAFEAAADGTFASSGALYGAPYAGPAFGIVFGSALYGGFAGFGASAAPSGPGGVATTPNAPGSPASGRHTLPVYRAPATGYAGGSVHAASAPTFGRGAPTMPGMPAAAAPAAFVPRPAPPPVATVREAPPASRAAPSAKR